MSIQVHKNEALPRTNGDCTRTDSLREKALDAAEFDPTPIDPGLCTIYQPDVLGCSEWP